MPIRYKTKYSSAQIFETSSAFLEYRRFEARRAVVCSLSAYKEPKLPGTSSAGRTLYPSIPDAKYRLRKHGCVQKGKFRYFGLKSCGIFSFLFPPPLLFFFILVQFFGARNLLGLISVGNVLRNSRLMVLEGRKCSWLVEDFHHHFWVNVTLFLSFYPGMF